MLVVFIISCTISIVLPDMYDHLAQIFNSFIIYLMGYYYISTKDYSHKRFFIGVSCIVLFIFETSMAIRIRAVSGILRAMLGIPLVFVATYLFEKINLHYAYRIFEFCGKYSLEMYLWNIYILQAVKYWNLGNLKYIENNGYVIYLMIILMGAFFSVVSNKIAKILCESLDKVKKD